MAKENVTTGAPEQPVVPPPTETPVRTLPMDEVKRLIRKISEDHEGLFRRLAK
jgi:hypothetical protein